MKPREHVLLHLHANLTDESKAYGYTLCIWGSGALLIEAFGLPNFLEAMSYVAGAVTGFALLAVIAYQGVFVNVSNEKEDQLIVGSMIHYLAAIGTVGLSILLHMDWAVLSFFLVGLNASVLYNIFLMVEAVFFEELQGLEATVHEKADAAVGDKTVSAKE